MKSIWVLIHSPLVGPLTWSLVADELRQRDVLVEVPTLDDVEGAHAPFWQQHAKAVARQVSHLPADRPVVLAGHSGAGPLLPTIRQLIPQPVAAYVFVDAGIPVDGMSRLELMASEDPEFTNQLSQHLTAGEHFPTWSDQDLRDVLPDPGLRNAMLQEMRPRPLAFFEEPIPVFAQWPDAPCSYLQFSSAYDVPADRARRLGWTYRQMRAGHFQMLVEPSTVARTLVEMVGSRR